MLQESAPAFHHPVGLPTRVAGTRVLMKCLVQGRTICNKRWPLNLWLPSAWLGCTDGAKEQAHRKFEEHLAITDAHSCFQAPM